MEKQKLSGKTILKLVGALLALAYLGFCLYAGITGKFPNMHKAEHVMRFGDLKNWVSGGISAASLSGTRQDVPPSSALSTRCRAHRSGMGKRKPD